MGQSNSKGAAAYSRPLIQGLPDALPHFDIKFHKPQDVVSFTFSPMDWECLDKPLHVAGKEIDASPALEMKDWRPTYNMWVAGVLTATFPKMFNQQTAKTEWMRHPLADAWLMEVTDTCAFGGVWDGNGGGQKGWAASHIAMWQTKHTLLKNCRQQKLKTTTDVAKLLENALMVSHQSILRVDEAQSTTAVLWLLLPCADKQYAMVFAAVGDVELYLYSQAKQCWSPLLHPFTDFRFKETAYKHRIEGGIGNSFGTLTELKEGMNLQYGAVMLAQQDIVLACTDGLGDVLDPVAARVPPKEVGVSFADWHHFAKQHALDGPAMVQDMKVKRLTKAVGPIKPELHPDDVQAVVNALTAFAMDSTKGERAAYADPANRNENGRVMQERVDKQRAAGIAAGDFSYAKMDHCGMLAFSPLCMTVPKPADAPALTRKTANSIVGGTTSMSMSMSISGGMTSVSEHLSRMGDRLAGLGLHRKSGRADK